MAKRNIEILVGLFVVLGLLALVFVALKAANLTSFSNADTYTADGALRQHRRPQAAGAGAQRRRGGGPRDLDRARPQDLPGRGDARRRPALPVPQGFGGQDPDLGLLGDQYIGIEPGGDDKPTWPPATPSRRRSRPWCWRT
jgi:phospholipid/cholesterol/gamma-HCH transport system substrate-binding protein